MNKKDIIPKASEVFRNSAPFFSKKVTFSEAFPDIDDIKVEVIETSEPKTDKMLKEEKYQNNKRAYGKLLGEFIDCSNRFCYNGGFSIGDIIRTMVSQKQISKEGSTICQGYEGSAKGRRRYRSCLHCFYYHVEIKYKDKNIPQTA